MFPEVPLSPLFLRVTLVGRERLFVENHDGLLEISDKRIRFRTRFGQIAVTGTHLKMDSDGAGTMRIQGAIAAVSTLGRSADAR